MTVLSKRSSRVTSPNVAMATELSKTSWSQRRSVGAGEDVEFRPHEPKVVALARAKHHPMLAESHRCPVAIGRDMPHREQAHVGDHEVCPLTLVRPHLEADQRVGAERVADGDVGRIATTRDQDPSDAGHVVPRIEGMPVAVHVRLEPRGKVHRAIRRQRADVAEVAGAVARGNVHAPAEGDREMRVVAADALPLREHLPRRSRRAGVRVVERDVVMHVVANGLHPQGARCGDFSKSDQATSESRSVSQYRLPRRNCRHSSGRSCTACCRSDSTGGSGRPESFTIALADSRIRPGGATSPRAPVAEGVAVERERHRRIRRQTIGNHDVAGAAVMDVHHQHHRRRLRTVVNQFVADS